MITISQPSSAEEAIELLIGTPVPFDSPTHHRYRNRTHLEASFASGRRRPEWVWIARDDAGSVLATVVGLSFGGGVAVEPFSGSDRAALTEALRAAADVARTLPDSEVGVFLPPELLSASLEVEPLVAALHDAGWRHLADRLHYEVSASDRLGSGISTALHLQPLHGPDDPRLRPLMRQMMRGSLDAHDVAIVAGKGLDAAADEAVTFILDADPWQCIRLAFAPGAGPDADPVGLVSWRSMAAGRGYLLQVGVAQAHRGHGYGAQLTALATRALIDEGSTTLVADTDVANAPMVAAFARAGWTPTETCSVFLPV